MPFYRRIMGSLRRIAGLWNIDRRVQKELEKQQNQRVQIGVDRLKKEHPALAIPAPIHMKNPELLGRLEHVKVESISGPPLSTSRALPERRFPLASPEDLESSAPGVKVPPGRIRVNEVYALLTAHASAAAASSDSERAEIWTPPTPDASTGAPSVQSSRPLHSRSGSTPAAQSQQQSHFDVARFASERGIAREKLDALAQHYSVLSVVRPLELTPAGKLPPVSLGALSPKLDFKLLELALAGKRDEVHAMMEQANLDHKEKREVLRILNEVARTGDVSIIPKWLTFDKVNRATDPFLHGPYHAGDEQPAAQAETSADRKTIESRATPAIESARTSNKLAPDFNVRKS